MKKTWIKVKRGLLEPKHIEKLGQAWYLYLYILDNANWETGAIPEWKDKYASDELDKPLGMIREHRKLLVSGEYITCKQKQRSQIITILNWTDPRRYDGVLQNESLGKEKHEPKKSKGNSQGKAQGSAQGCAQGSGQGSGQGVGEQADKSLSSYNHIPHNTDSHNTDSKRLIKLSAADKKLINRRDIKPFFTIWEQETKLQVNVKEAAALFGEFIRAGVTPAMFRAAIKGQRADTRYGITTPKSVKTWALNSVKKGKERALTGADYRESWQKWLDVN